MNNHMNEEILNKLAPCGILCEKCFAYTDGTIRKSSIELKKALGNFDVYAQRFTELLNEPVFKKYVDFKELLTYFTTAQCNGCRKEACKLFKSCKVRDCHKEKGVDFCFQCAEFPCSNTGFDEHLYKRSVEINRRIREIGVERYYKEVKDRSRYQ